jgi:hypothetical protein
MLYIGEQVGGAFPDWRSSERRHCRRSAEGTNLATGAWVDHTLAASLGGSCTP